eukprot:TRINITY_DN132_c1_g1_i2.p1 TRINITY_DN132_c1_g1~~TRINITY_DN132_c1_g1_i2.p1  ORF type:complete len:130 (+),score=0.61 TRINITY_DN132_c1_g1_i2:238-627(+)
MPPAFVLSQDQTLKLTGISIQAETRTNTVKSRSFKARDQAETQSLGPAEAGPNASVRPPDQSTRSPRSTSPSDQRYIERRCCFTLASVAGRRPRIPSIASYNVQEQTTETSNPEASPLQNPPSAGRATF